MTDTDIDLDAISRLVKSDGWQAIRERLAMRREHLHQVLLAQMMTGGPGAKPADQRFIDYTRGFVDGAEWVLDNPVKALDKLSRLAEQEREETRSE